MSDSIPLSLRDRLREKRRLERPDFDAVIPAKTPVEPSRAPTHIELIREMASANAGVVRVSDVRRELIARNMVQGNPRNIYYHIVTTITRSRLFEKCDAGTYRLKDTEPHPAPEPGRGDRG
jgi:hypothetical protein